MADDRLIVALDVSSLEAMQSIVTSLGDSVSYYKVGMELFYAAGEQTVAYLRDHNKSVFLDLKLHDIPNTVAHGIKSLTRLGAKLITIHSQGGKVMMEAAMKAAKEQAAELGIERPKLLAITALTSFDDENWSAIGGSLPISDHVVKLANLAKEAGVIVTPGIRPSFAATNDQKRIATPSSALQDGASRIVVGRPITQAEHPQEAVRLIVEEMETVQK